VYFASPSLYLDFIRTFFPLNGTVSGWTQEIFAGDWTTQTIVIRCQLMWRCLGAQVLRLGLVTSVKREFPSEFLAFINNDRMLNGCPGDTTSFPIILQSTRCLPRLGLRRQGGRRMLTPLARIARQPNRHLRRELILKQRRRLQNPLPLVPLIHNRY